MPMGAHPSMSEGKSAGFLPSFFRGPYTANQGNGIGLGGGGHGSPPSATSTPVFRNSQAVGLWLVFFEARTARLGKTATVANKTSVASVPRTLSIDIFISLKKLARVGAADASTVLDPAQRVGGN